jgi:hypothetical protein
MLAKLVFALTVVLMAGINVLNYLLRPPPRPTMSKVLLALSLLLVAAISLQYYLNLHAFDNLLGLMMIMMSGGSL